MRLEEPAVSYMSDEIFLPMKMQRPNEPGFLSMHQNTFKDPLYQSEARVLIIKLLKLMKIHIIFCVLSYLWFC